MAGAEDAAPEDETFLERGDGLIGLAGAHLRQAERLERVGDTRVVGRQQPATHGERRRRRNGIASSSRVSPCRVSARPFATSAYSRLASPWSATFQIERLPLLDERLLEAAELAQRRAGVEACRCGLGPQIHPAGGEDRRAPAWSASAAASRPASTEDRRARRAAVAASGLRSPYSRRASTSRFVEQPRGGLVEREAAIDRSQGEQQLGARPRLVGELGRQPLGTAVDHFAQRHFAPQRALGVDLGEELQQEGLHRLGALRLGEAGARLQQGVAEGQEPGDERRAERRRGGGAYLVAADELACS